MVMFNSAPDVQAATAVVENILFANLYLEQSGHGSKYLRNNWADIILRFERQGLQSFGLDSRAYLCSVSWGWPSETF